MDDDLLMLSGLQHFAFCRRQWALIHIEQQWGENIHTAQGEVFHARAHDEKQTELRGDTLIVRGLRIQSQRLGLTGICDVVEFHKAKNGIRLSGREGEWEVYPVEYKKGAPKMESAENADALQLCAQAICLEEMLVCQIPEGSLFYGETRRRQRIEFTSALRDTVSAMTREMHEYARRGYTPRVKKHKGCAECSLGDICLPKMEKAPAVHTYLDNKAREAEE